MTKKKGKPKDRESLVKYIKAKQGGIKYYAIYSLTGFGGSYQAIEDLDVIKKLLKYISKLMDKTLTFKDYLEKRLKGKVDSVATRVSQRQKYIDELEEEVFYLVHHINHYEEQANE